MMKRLTAALIFMLMAAATALSPALAIGDDVFVVPRVTVQAQAGSATAAKAAAQRLGRRKAMDILLRRLTMEEDWAYLPTLAAGEPAEAYTAFDRGVIELSDRDLELLESGFEVYDEKSSSTTYRAYITYRFKPESVRRLLKDARIPYSEAQTRTALVLPVLQTGSGVYLWEENNPWMAAWKARPYDNELTPMVAPLGDLEDAATISARTALALDQTALENMAQRYSVSQVIIAHAVLQQQNGEDRLRVRLINGFRESASIGAIDELSPYETDPAAASTDYAQGPETNDFNPAKVGDILAEEWFAQASGNFPSLAEISINVSIAKYAKPWKEKTLIDHSSLALLTVSAHYRSLGEWTQIRSALLSTPLVGSVQVRSLSRLGAEMLIQAYGEPSKLTVAMEAQGLVLWTEDGDHWLIATPSTAQSVKGNDRRRRRRFGEENSQDADIYPASANPSDSSVTIESAH